MVPELVALDLEQGDSLVAAVESAWRAGDAVTVLDRRWGERTRQVALAALRPTVIIDDAGRRDVEGGLPSDEGDSLVVLTSGSLAEPKAAVLTLAAVAASAALTSAALKIDPSRHRWLCCLPSSHIGGLSVITRALLSATPLEVLSRAEPDALAAAARRGATHVSLVATTLSRIDPSSFELILLGGSAPPRELPANVIATYGMTETGSGVVYDGRPLPGVALAIDAADADGFGEILISSPTSLRAYRDRPAPMMTGPDGDNRWLRSGDLGRLDPTGRLEVRGRIAEVIVTGAEKVYPSDVEAVIAELPGVAEVAVWKRADLEWGERVVAWIVPHGEPPTLAELRSEVAVLLGAYAAPKELELVEALPRSPLGKLRRSLLS